MKETSLSKTRAKAPPKTATKAPIKTLPTKEVAQSKNVMPEMITTKAPRLGISPEERHQMIAVSAYYIAEKDGHSPLKSEEYWLQAESEINDLLLED